MQRYIITDEEPFEMKNVTAVNMDEPRLSVLVHGHKGYAHPTLLDIEEEIEDTKMGALLAREETLVEMVIPIDRDDTFGPKHLFEGLAHWHQCGVSEIQIFDANFDPVFIGGE